ncbi:MAG: BTAD domain-containing putative transcriptional regulator [Betaproteobacteria bacterium]|nr:BTAD domain-containing putative transcriptional regulator [Betaproteobacteria bacterium]
MKRLPLFQVIDKAKPHKILWISGPPGAGKTTLIASYLEQANLPAMWYQVDEWDSDPATLFNTLGRAAQVAFPKQTFPLPPFIPEYHAALRAFAGRYFRALFGSLRRPFALVFDNLQDAGSADTFHEILQEALTQVPDHSLVVLVSRSEPSGVYARGRAQAGWAMIDWEMLRLTKDETAEIARLHGKEIQDGASLARLHAEAQGWVSGLVLMLEGNRFGSPSCEQPIESSFESVFRVFANEILRKNDEASQLILLKTSVMPAFSSEQAALLTGEAGADYLFVGMHRKNYFLVKDSSLTLEYEYHPLFREFLLVEATKRFSPGELATLRIRAAMLLEKAGRFEHAVVLYAEAEDWQNAARMVLEHAPHMLAQGSNRTVEKWIALLPATTLGSSPWLVYWLGSCRMAFNPVEGRHLFEKAYRQFEASGMRDGLLLAWCGIADTFVLEFSDFRPFQEWVLRLESLLAASPEFPSPEIEMRVAISGFAALHFSHPFHPRLRQWQSQIEAFVQDPMPSPAKGMISALLVHHLILTGDLRKAAMQMRLLGPAIRGPESSPMNKIFWSVVEGIYFWQVAEIDASKAALQEGLDVGAATGIHINDGILTLLTIYAALSEGATDVAGSLLQGLPAKINPLRRLDVAHVHFVTGWHALICGDAHAALAHVEASRQLIESAGAYFPKTFNRIASGHVYCVLGQYERVEQILGEIGRDTDAAGSDFLKFEAHLLAARLASLRSDEAALLTSLRAALSLGRSLGMMNHVWAQPRVISQLLVKALESGIETEYVNEWIRKHKLVPASPPIDVEHWRWRIKVYTLGRFTLVKDGATLRAGSKAQGKPLELLKALVAMGGRDVSLALLSEALWPDSEGDVAAGTLDTTLHRLRKLLGDRDALALTDGKLSINAHHCWIDVWAFERLLGTIESLFKQGEVSDPRLDVDSLFANLLQMYQGEFLSQEDDVPWAIAARSRLHTRVLRVFAQIGRRQEENGCWERAIECYRKGIEVAPASEAFYQRLMISHHRLGQRADALAVYRRCQAALDALLSIAPSAETVSLHQSIIRS